MAGHRKSGLMPAGRTGCQAQTLNFPWEPIEGRGQVPPPPTVALGGEEPGAKPGTPGQASQGELLPAGLRGTSPSLDLETKCKKSALESFPCEV